MWSFLKNVPCVFEKNVYLCWVGFLPASVRLSGWWCSSSRVHLCWFFLSSSLSYWKWSIDISNYHWWIGCFNSFNFLSFCLLYFRALLLQAYSFIIGISFEVLTCLSLWNIPLCLWSISSSLFCLKLTYPFWLWYGYCLHAFFHPFTFSIAVHLDLKCITFGQHIFGGSFIPAWQPLPFDWNVYFIHL